MDQKYLVGAAIGVTGTAAAVYLYQRNKTVVDTFLRDQGINVPEVASNDFSKMSLEELLTTKERIEDLVAERELTVESE